MPRIDVLSYSPHGRTWRKVGRHVCARNFVFARASWKVPKAVESVSRKCARYHIRRGHHNRIVQHNNRAK